MSEAIAARPDVGVGEEVRPRWLLFPVVAGAAAFLAGIAGGGGVATVAVNAFGIVAMLVALGPPVGAVAMLIVVASLDGFIKGIAPGWFTLLLKDIVLWLAVFRWMLLRRMGDYAGAPTPAMTAMLAAFVLWVFAEAVNVFTVSWLVALAGVRTWVGWVPVFFIAYESIRDRKDMLTLLLTLTITAGLVGAYGMVQQAIGYDHLLRVSGEFWYVERLGITGGRYRAMATLPHPGMFGHYMGMALPLALTLALTPLLAAGQRLAAAGAALATAGGALASGGRLAAGAVLTAGVLVLLLVRQARALFIGLLLAGAIGLGAVRLVSPEAVWRATRVFDWSVTIHRIVFPFKKAMQAAMKTPLGTGVATGVGIGRARRLIGDVQIARGAGGMVENEFGRAFRELGIPGGALFTFMVLFIVLGALRIHISVRDPAWRYISAGLTAMLVAEVLGLLVGPAFYLMPVAALFWIAYASILRLGQLEGEAGLGRQGEQVAGQSSPQ